MPEILFAILHFLVCTLLLSGVLLLLQRRENKWPRVYLAIFSLVAASEFAYRLYVTYRMGMVTAVSPGDSTEKDEAAPCNPLWMKLALQMDEKELWRNPDLTLEDLSRNPDTNRTTLSARIQ